MDETSTQLPSSDTRQKHRSLPFLRLLGTFLFACLMLSYFGAPVRATSQTAPSSVFSISQAATPGGWSTVHYNDVTLAVPAA